ncbi:type I restriction endonuclease subunit R [Polaromonas sp. DSR2-3-2]|uniref:type I restriction endonuclease subunit R n=1 Tax=unclassified Polaromonas TaxID=2638319 RepID=UPI003CF23592
MKFTEAQLEQAIIDLLGNEGYSHVIGEKIERSPEEVLIKDDLRAYLRTKYAAEKLTNSEIELIIKKLELLPSSDLYGSNKLFMLWVSDGFIFRREDAANKDLSIHLIDYVEVSQNIYKLVNQLEIVGYEKRIPDGILYINGIPFVVFEFKSAVREKATVHDAFVQLTVRYRRDLPELLKYNAFCVISDGINNKIGSIFSPYEHFYAWRKIDGMETVGKDGIDSLLTMIKGLFKKVRLCDVIHNFIFFPDNPRVDEKIVCRYPQYYATKRLYSSILNGLKPAGSGKGGTYFGATGCGKSYTMLFLSRLLMKSLTFANPTIILITDRTDLDNQLAAQFTAGKTFIGDDQIISVENREELRTLLAGQASGGVFLTTIQKFTEDTKCLTKRNNVICISDEAHRSQTNLDPKIRIYEDGIDYRYGFAKHLRDSLPEATFVGFTGTPIETTIKVFGDVVDTYTMAESVQDEITVPLAYERRFAKVALNSVKVKEIEEYYAKCANDGANFYAVEESKYASTQIDSILGDSNRLKLVAKDFVTHYERRLSEGATVAGKALFVCSNRTIAYNLYREIIALRLQWAECDISSRHISSANKSKKEAKPIERIRMVMTRNQDDDAELYKLLGSKDYKKELDRQFKIEDSNFKIAIVVDMWSTGFDVPSLDTIYIDKPIELHNLIQTISRVNRKFAGKEKGLVVDYIGIRPQLNIALKQFATGNALNIDEVEDLIKIARANLATLDDMFVGFDFDRYYGKVPVDRLYCLRDAAEFVQETTNFERKFMSTVKGLNSAYEICSGNDDLLLAERSRIHFYTAIRSILFKLTKGNAPDLQQMNSKVRDMVNEALRLDEIDTIIGIGYEEITNISLIDDETFEKIESLSLVSTKAKVLQSIIARAIASLERKNRVKSVSFGKKFQSLVDRYNLAHEDTKSSPERVDGFLAEFFNLCKEISLEQKSVSHAGLSEEQAAFYDILRSLADQNKFFVINESLLILSKKIADLIVEKARFTDWNCRPDIGAELQAGLIILLEEGSYSGVGWEEVYKEIFEQAKSLRGIE